MSKHKLYQVHDNVAEIGIGPIMLAHKDGPAMRDFTTVLKDQNTQLGQHPADYDLRWLGDIDDETGTITPARNGPVTVMTGASWLEIHSASREKSKLGADPLTSSSFAVHPTLKEQHNG